MHSAQTRPLFARRTIALLLALFSAAIAMLAGATSAFAHNTQICLTLNPPTATNQLPQQSSHTVTATLTKTLQYSGSNDPDVYCNDPEVTKVAAGAGLTVYFDVMSGPNAGAKGSGVTDANGQATFTWSSSNAGTDVVEAYTAMEYDDQTGLPLWDPVTIPNGSVSWASASKIWLPPTTPVTPQGAPDSALSVSKKCQSRKFTIKSSYTNGTATKFVLQVDGKTVKTTTSGGSSDSGSKSFTIDSGKYSSGTHSIKLTTYFSDGTRVVKTGKFKRCAVRTTARRISPNFTG
ncbi:MAG: hypothetical protein ACRDKI_00260 [Solirubrobacterales bacterium]